jgi:hypothetical protein
MKALYAIVAAASLLHAGPALAAGDAVIDVAELTCAQFTKYSDDDKAVIMMWFEGYYKSWKRPTRRWRTRLLSATAREISLVLSDTGKLP